MEKALLEQFQKLADKIDDVGTRMSNRIDDVAAAQKSMREEVSGMRNDLARVAVTQENVILPQLTLLAEGQETIQNQIKGLSVIDAMQTDISILKSAVRHLAQELDSLRNA